VSTDAVRNRVRARVGAEINGNASGSSERLLVELEPARRAAAWQAPVRNRDVGRGTGSGDARPTDPHRRACREQTLRARPFAYDRNTGIVRAIAGRLPVENVRIAVKSRSLGEQAANIVPSPVAKKQRGSVLDHGKVSSVAHHQQIRLGRHHRRHRTEGDRHEAQDSDPAGPQPQPHQATRNQPECPGRHAGEHRQSCRAGDRVSKAEERFERQPGEPPRGRTEPEAVEGQR